MKRCALLLVGLVCLVGAQPAQAQFGIGPQLAWSDEFDLGIGGRAEFRLANALGVEDGVLSELTAMPSATYFFPSCGGGVSCNAWEVNPNAVLPFRLAEAVTSYFGSGLRVAGWSTDAGGGSVSDTDVGLNILGGLKFPIGSRNGFVEGKFGFIGADHFSLTTGILLGGP